jgi:hypothetical protein
VHRETSGVLFEVRSSKCSTFGRRGHLEASFGADRIS